MVILSNDFLKVSHPALVTLPYVQETIAFRIRVFSSKIIDSDDSSDVDKLSFIISSLITEDD